MSLTRGLVRAEGDDPGPSWAPGKAAIVAQWSATANVTRSLDAYCRALVAGGFEVVVVSACESAEALRWPQGRPPAVHVLRKPNVGYDFGSWSVALDRYPALWAADRVLLTNDSLVGPFAALDEVFSGFDQTRADVWGLTDTYQFVHHLQSYCVGFGREALSWPPLAAFFGGIRQEKDKTEIIWRNELGLARLLRQEGFTLEAAFPADLVVARGDNPTVRGWRGLLDQGFPFVKREIVTNPSVAPWGNTVPAVLAKRFGVDVQDWL